MKLRWPTVVAALVIAIGVSLFAARDRGAGPPAATHRDRSKPHWADRAALVVALVSLLVSVVAVVASVRLAVRPYPADPTQHPTFGTPQEHVYLETAADSYALFDFLRDNAGRKVRLSVGFEKHGPFHLAEPGGLVVPGPDCPPDWKVGGEFCNVVELRIEDVSEQRQGLVFQHGAHVLSGYFANEGSLGIWTGVEVISITPLTAVEAVS